MPIYQTVLAKLAHTNRSRSNPNKSLAQVILDGTYSKADLQSINESTAFPNNNYNQLKLPEGPYTSGDAMMQFVRTIGPFLSDQALYHLAHTLAEIETAGNNQGAYRTSSLAKAVTVYELERHSTYVTKEEPIPAVFLSHMQTFVLPLCDKVWGSKNLESNINKFGTFNFKNELMSKSAKEKFKAVGCDVDVDFNNVTSLEAALSLKTKIEENYSFYPLVEAFKAENLDVKKLSTTAEKAPDDFPIALKQLEDDYQKQKEEAAKSNLAVSLKNMTGTMAKSAPVKSVSKPQHPPVKTITKQPSSFSLNPLTWFGGKPTATPTPDKKDSAKRATLSENNIPQLQESLPFNAPQTGLTAEKRKLRYTQSFMGPPIEIPPSERTVEIVQKELSYATERLAHYNGLIEKTAEEASKLSIGDNSKNAIKTRENLSLYAKHKKKHATNIPLLEAELKTLMLQQSAENKREIKRL